LKIIHKTHLVKLHAIRVS